jgi:hypothetical protein
VRQWKELTPKAEGLFRRSAALPWNGAKGTNLGVVFHREKGPAASCVVSTALQVLK